MCTDFHSLQNRSGIMVINDSLSSTTVYQFCLLQDRQFFNCLQHPSEDSVEPRECEHFGWAGVQI